MAPNGANATTISKAQKFKRAKYSVSMLPAEHDAIVALKHRLSDLVGAKTKKSDIVRAGVLLLLSLPDAKIRAALGKISALNGTSMTTEDEVAAYRKWFDSVVPAAWLGSRRDQARCRAE